MATFDYFEAFSRNIGWVTTSEQEKLRHSRIAIAGMGGVGGVHLLTLARMGIGAFNISDLDHFELANFNRQAGAMVSTLDKPKVEVLAGMASDINPELDIRQFPAGVNEHNIDDFLQDVDLYVDGLDFFVLSARKLVYQKCHEKGIPIIVTAPLGMGVSMINYLPGQMALNDFFGFEDDMNEEELLFRFLIGLSPRMLQTRYLVDKTTVDLKNHKGPSTPMACQLCAGVTGTNAVKILLNRGKVLAAPHGYHYDAYRNKAIHTWRPGGNRNPLQRLILTIAKWQLARQ